MKKILLVLLISVMALSACGTTKPSKQDVKDGYFKMTSTRSGSLDKTILRKATDCIVDEVYDKLSPEGAKVFADGNINGKGTQNDLKLISAAGTTCGKKLASQQ